MKKCTVCGEEVSEFEFHNEDFEVTVCENGIKQKHSAACLCLECSNKIFIKA